MTTNKDFRGTLILDYKNGNMRIAKRRPSTIKASEIPIDVKLTVKIPETPQLEAKGEIILSDAKVSELTIEAL